MICFYNRDYTSKNGGELILGKSDSRLYRGCFHYVRVKKAMTSWQFNVQKYYKII